MEKDGKSVFSLEAKEIEDYVINLRREFHMHPEIAFKEERTSARICEELEKHGIAYETIGKNMVVATIEGERPGKTIGLRGDMDGLPMKEETLLPYASQNEGVMHSCGHDAHMAILIGTGILLQKKRELLSGKVKLIFHAAEEVAGGVPEILSYLKESGGVDRLMGIHVWADIPAGCISVEAGGRMAGGIFFEIEVEGKGGHGSRPDKIKDPIKPICQILLQITAIPSNRYSMLEPCVVSPGLISAGTAFNIIPDTARIGGSLRFFSYEAGEALMSLVKLTAEKTAEAYGAEAKVTFSGHVSPIVNDEESVKLGKKIVEEIQGLELTAFEPICACDCFGDLLKQYPGVYCYLGVRNEEKDCIYPQHHCKYKIDESALRKGVEFMSQYSYEYLSLK